MLDETTPSEVVPSSCRPRAPGGEATPSDRSLNKAPNEVAPSETISSNAESNKTFKTGTERGSFRPW